MFAKTIRPTNVVPVVGSRASTAFGKATVRVPPVLDVVEFGAGVEEHAPNRSDKAANAAADANNDPELIFRLTHTMGDIPASFGLLTFKPPLMCQTVRHR